MPNYNLTILIGHLTRDPELRYTQGGVAILKCGIASNSGYGENKRTAFVDFTAFGKTAELIERSDFHKGSAFGFQGRLQTEEWEKEGQKRQKLVAICDQIIFLGKSEKKQGDGEEERDPSKNPYSREDPRDGDVDMESVPF